MGRSRKRLIGKKHWMIWTLLVALACSGYNDPGTSDNSRIRDEPGISDGTADPVDPPLVAAYDYQATLRVVDEAGRPIENATIAPTKDATITTASDGRFLIVDVNQPILLMVEAPGRLKTPVVIDRNNPEVVVTLLSETGPSGEPRIVFHFGGDVMMGRRYLSPTREGTHQVVKWDGGDSARALGNAIQPVFAAAHVRSVNLETVVGELPMEAAYPGKRFLLQSPPEICDLLKYLQVDLVTLGNNHIRDWMERGISTTISELDQSRIDYVGGGITETAASLPLIKETRGRRIGMLSYTSVNGDYVNDNMPVIENDDMRSITIPEQEIWQYEQRFFGFQSNNITIQDGYRNIGKIWREIERAEKAATPNEIAELWAAAETVYPELQDWVARRGHGGANAYASDKLKNDIERLLPQTDLIVVQFHSGYQFGDTKSKLIEAAAHRAIDAGADLVVGHHPHVLKGLEWYRGKLIAYSLGNFIFDQDFLMTFPSAVLRVVFEGNEMVQAALLPAALLDYKPVPLSGAGAEYIFQMIHERSSMPMHTDRIEGKVRTVLSSLDSEATVPRLVYDAHIAQIKIGPPDSRSQSIVISDGQIWDLDKKSLTRTRTPRNNFLLGIQLGKDLFRWGNFEDMSADGISAGGLFWSIEYADYERVDVIPDAPSGIRALRLRRTSSNTTRVSARPVARITLKRHRYYEEIEETAVPLDGDPTYAVRFKGRLNGNGIPQFRMTLYHFDDENPTEDPMSLMLREVEFDMPLDNDDQWHDVCFDLPSDVFGLDPASGVLPNTAMLYVGLEPPEEGVSVFYIDDLQFLEWRNATELPDIFSGYHAIRIAPDADRETMSITIQTTAP